MSGFRKKKHGKDWPFCRNLSQKSKNGYLARYATMVSSADKGAVFPR
jgi:hypothetical protein